MKFFRSLALVALFFLIGNSAIVQKKKYDFVEIQTPKGSIWLYLYDATPQHKENFLRLAREGFFDSTTFHRVIPEFMIQGGDPNSKDNDTTNDGEGDFGERIPAEITDTIRHFYGAVGAARDNNPQKASSYSQFYLVEGKKWDELQLKLVAKRNGVTYTPEEIKRYIQEGGTPHLDMGYTVFGQVLAGMSIVKEIARVPANGTNRPLVNIPVTVKVHTLKPKKLQRKYDVHFDISKMQVQ